MKPVVIYQRVSTQDQNFDSQVDDLKKWAEDNNFNVVASFGEKITGYDPEIERLEYDKMKAYVFKHNIKNIAIWEISRLSRSMAKLKSELKIFTDKEVNIYFKKENVNSLSQTTMDKFVINMLGSMAELESDTIRERTERGRITAIKKGKMMCYSTYPYGYTTDTNGIIKIEETEAQVVKMIFDMAISGQTLYYISSHLNTSGVPTRLQLKGRTKKYKNGNEGLTKWTPVTVTRILKRTLYKGIRIYKDMTVPVPRILTDEDWDLVQERFTNNVGYLNNTKHDYLFKGKLKCGRCKRMITTHIMRRKIEKHNSKYYECEGYKKENNKCDDRRISLNIDVVDKNLFDILFNHKYIKEIMTIKSSQALEKENIIKQINNCNNEIVDLESKGKRLKRMFADGHSDYEEFNKEMNSVKYKVTEMNNKISLLQSELESFKIDVNEIIKTYKNSDNYLMKREFVVKYVNSIFMYRPDVANVNWENPLHKDEKIIYFEIYVFNFKIPLKVLMTPFSKNVMVSSSFEYLRDYNMVTDISKKITIL